MYQGWWEIEDVKIVLEIPNNHLNSEKVCISKIEQLPVLKSRFVSFALTEPI